MPVEYLDAACKCDACGKPFRVEVEAATKLTPYLDQDLETIVRDNLVAGNARAYTLGIRGKHTLDRFDLDYQATLQGGYILCDVCSRKCDDAPIEGALSKEQVEDILGLVQL